MTTTLAETVLVPADEKEAQAAVSEAAAAGGTLHLTGGGTRTGLGRPSTAKGTLSSAGLTGISFYEPAELVIGVKAGTPVHVVETALAQSGQMLAFEPMDHRAIYGTTGEPTIGGVAAVNASGPRRVAVGAARDALLGVRFANGRGELIKSGGRVMKNVTGLDLVKLMCGSYGTLGFLTEVSFKALPRPEQSLTLKISGLADEAAIAALSAALGSPFQPSGAAHLPAGIAGTEANTLIRIEGFRDSVAHRLSALSRLLAQWGAADVVEGDVSADLWRDVRDVRLLAEPRDRVLWRISAIPSDAPKLAAAIAAKLSDAEWYFDWGGGLVWLSLPATPDAGSTAVRGAVAEASGHATLIRAPDATKLRVPVFQPQPPAVAKLSAGIKRSFDPSGIFAPGANV